MNTVWVLVWVGYMGAGGNSSAALTAHKTEAQCSAAADVMTKAHASRFQDDDRTRTMIHYRKSLVCIESIK